MIINRIYKNKNLLSLWLVSFLVRLRTYQHPCITYMPQHIRGSYGTGKKKSEESLTD